MHTTTVRSDLAFKIAMHKECVPILKKQTGVGVVFHLLRMWFGGALRHTTSRCYHTGMVRFQMSKKFRSTSRQIIETGLSHYTELSLF
jgi:hypothetical protein